MRTVTFGDLRGDTWGAALSPHPDLPSFAVLGPEPAAVLRADIRSGSSEEDEWRIVGEGLELLVAPESSPARDSAAIDQLATVRGRVRGGGAREVESRGCRSERAEALDPGRSQLFRDVCAWFGPGDGFAFVAIRPRRGSGHGDERVSATVFSGGHALAVGDPRLSTTYGEEGGPLRATLEMWLTDDDEKGEREETLNYPRRAAGTAADLGVVHDVGQLAVRVQPFRWRAQGRDGAGIYLLARAR